MNTRIKDMTEGSPLKLIVTFAIPLMIGNAFQQFYSMVDTIVVGQGVGVEALAALGAADWINWMILGVVLGFTQGFSILISQVFGENNQQKLKKVIAMCFVVGILMAILLTIGSILMIKPLLILLNTPENILQQSISYLTIIFSGILVITIYNTFSAILRALGDSKTPLYAMMFAALINIGLDLLFVIGFKKGVVGAAIATVIAQFSSSLFCLKALSRIEIIQVTKKDFKLDGAIISRLCELGIVTAFQNIIISVGGMVVQSVVNGFGFIFVAGFTATNKLYGLLELAAISLGYSVATYSGQNLGAKKYQRIKKGMRTCAILSVLTSFILSGVLIPFGKVILHLFVSGDQMTTSQVLDVAYHYLFIMLLFLWILYLLHVFRSCLQGMGNTIVPMISGIAELTMRVGIALILPRFIGQEGIFYAEIFAWLGAVIILIPAYFIFMNKLTKPSYD